VAGGVTMVYEGIRYGYPKVKRTLGERIAGFIQLMRPFTCIAALIAGFSLSYFFGILAGTPPTFLYALLIGLVLGLLQAGAQAFQQSIYIETLIDIENGKDYRPTCRGVITLEEGKTFAFILFLTGVTLAFVLKPILGLFAFIITLFAVFYVAPPLRIKEKFILNNLWQGIARGFLPAIYVASAYGYGWLAIYFGIALMLWITGAQTTKDYGDEKGDSKYNVRTFPVVLGRRRTLYVMAFFMGSAFTLLNILILLNIFPLSFLLLNILILPSILILYGLTRMIVLRQLENNLSWVGFYTTLALFYTLPAILIVVG